MSFIFLAAEPSMLMGLFVDYFLPITLSLGIFIILWMLKKLSVKFSDKLDAETKLNNQEVINSIIAQGASLAERWGNNVKKDINTVVVSGNEKMLKAVEFVSEELRRKQFSNIEEREIKDKIEAYLGIGDMNSVGFPTDFIIPSNPEEDGNEDFYNTGG